MTALDNPLARVLAEKVRELADTQAHNRGAGVARRVPARLPGLVDDLRGDGNHAELAAPG